MTLRRSADDFPVPLAKLDSSTASLPVVDAIAGSLQGSHTAAVAFRVWTPHSGDKIRVLPDRRKCESFCIQRSEFPAFGCSHSFA